MQIVPPLLPAHKITNLYSVSFRENRKVSAKRDTFAFQYSLLHTSLPYETFGDFKAGSSAAVHLNLEKR
ncbi:hypothetical protein [Paenibacillus brasilensis]|uniref:Uncharacterized protein n=1 Tax=Paenibacillus brasilensis TaxID=128574 RepID=A0ABU0L4H4_9BACL|nr:hypothetical protein [Paenibacillus brasilensis]MDQ0496170.1 hypothetical protein [Paenibacillus brasilensis]